MGPSQSPGRPGTLWERACSRRGHNIQHLCWMCRPLREQARSHIGISSVRIFRDYQVPVVAPGKLSLPVSTNLIVPNKPPASLPRST
ncbi:hypothetical protein EYC95_00825 [Pseudomonas sp. BGI-2]|nr:hypothetical protein EYC95_00825 [Pseudomonas sp. BGI-2]